VIGKGRLRARYANDCEGEWEGLTAKFQLLAALITKGPFGLAEFLATERKYRQKNGRRELVYRLCVSW
jgi:hypothetical protein